MKGKLLRQSAFFTSEWTEGRYSLRDSILQETLEETTTLVDLSKTSCALEGVFTREISVGNVLYTFVLRWFDEEESHMCHFGTSDAKEAEMWMQAISSVFCTGAKISPICSNDQLVSVKNDARFFVRKFRNSEIVLVKYVGRPKAGFKEPGNFPAAWLRTTWGAVTAVAPGHWRAAPSAEAATFRAEKAEWRIFPDQVLAVELEFDGAKQGLLGRLLLRFAEYLGDVWFNQLW